ncbi:MAG TPA: hypothetical protein VFQ07_10780 [Candidatus Polarisedimenticolia bacterium]|nr:hypothetical protein [Candidatus Polarisedimenticolia bacterium]
MKRRWPKTIWLGLAVVVAAPLLYMFLFIRYPITRDVPWVPLLIFAAGLALLLHGLGRAYRDPGTFRGKVAAPVALGFGLALTAFFCFGFLVLARRVPASRGAPRVGQLAPDFSLPDQDGRLVTLSQLIASPPAGAAGSGAVGAPSGSNGAGANGAVLVFYRGYW